MKKIVSYLIIFCIFCSVFSIGAIKAEEPTSISIINGSTVKAERVGTAINYEEAYVEGDCIVLRAPIGSYMEVTLDPMIEPAQIYFAKDTVEFPIPFGDRKKGRYDSKAFTGDVHSITMKEISKEDRSAYRNLAVNPLDYQVESEKTNYTAPVGANPTFSQAVEKGEISAYPHAYANRVNKSRDSLSAANAINGLKDKNHAHGNYPLISWAGGMYDDLEFVVYFGREVTVDKVVITLRQDLSADKTNGGVEHDTYWESGQLLFSNGTTFGIQLKQTAGQQSFSFPEQTVSWVKLKNLKRATYAWTALTELEVYGVDKEAKDSFKTKELSSKTVKSTVQKVNDYFMENYPVDEASILKLTPEAQYGWNQAAYHAGNAEAFKTIGDIDFYNFSYEYGKLCNWMKNDTDLANNLNYYAIGQSYLSLYDCMPNNDTLSALIDGIRTTCIDKENAEGFKTLALAYTVMPTMAQLSRITGDESYNDAAYKMFKNIDAWYDKEDHLWYSDNRFVFNGGELGKSPNGKKVFWSRDNALVYVALGRTLANMSPKNKYYDEYATYFKDMSKELISRQQKDGFWYSNLDDSKHYDGQETGGTAGFMYGLAWGINQGLLDEATYFAPLKKAWDGITKTAITPEGKLCYVQGESYSEEEIKEETQPYAVGFFAMAGAEMMKLCADYKSENMPNIPEENIGTMFGIEPGYYKGEISATATSFQETATIDANPSHLMDGKVDEEENTRWSAQNFPQSATIDLLKPLAIRKLVLMPYHNRPYKYKIYTSTDGANYELLVDASQQAGKAGPCVHQLPTPKTFRYIKLEVLGCFKEDVKWVTIQELFIYEAKPESVEGLQFADVAKDSWYYDAVSTCVEKGVMNGVSETSFNPDGTVTRGMFVTMLGRLAGASTNGGASGFVDVANTDYFAPYVSWAVEQKLVSGVGEGVFAPNAPITREQMAKILKQYVMEKHQLGTKEDFSLPYKDKAAISSWAVEGVDFCAQYGLMQGSSEGLFDPQGMTTRAQAAAVLKRILEL